jgi:hypothetical protein
MIKHLQVILEVLLRSFSAQFLFCGGPSIASHQSKVRKMRTLLEQKTSFPNQPGRNFPVETADRIDLNLYIMQLEGRCSRGARLPRVLVKVYIINLDLIRLGILIPAFRIVNSAVRRALGAFSSRKLSRRLLEFVVALKSDVLDIRSLRSCRKLVPVYYVRFATTDAGELPSSLPACYRHTPTLLVQCMFLADKIVRELVSRGVSRYAVALLSTHSFRKVTLPQQCHVVRSENPSVTCRPVSSKTVSSRSFPIGLALTVPTAAYVPLYVPSFGRSAAIAAAPKAMAVVSVKADKMDVRCCI